MTKVLLVDDHPFFLHGFGQYLSENSDFAVETALSVEEAIDNIDKEPPDLAMLDVTMHGGGGLKILSHIHKKYPDIRSMFLTVHIDPAQTIEAVELGVKGIALKDEAPDDILQGMKKVLAGEKYFDSDVTETALEHSIKSEAAPVRSDDLLTNREREIVDLVCTGLRNKDIADKCEISEGTVKIHLNSIFRKLGLQSRSELIVKRGGIKKMN